MRTGMKTPRGQLGMTLVEIMVAIAISGILLTGVLQIFLSSKQSYRVLEATARVQEAGRFAVSFMTEDLRMAGYTGCYRGDLNPVDNILNDPNAFMSNINIPIEGNEWTGSGWSPPLDPLIAGEVLEGTDVVIIRGMANDGIHLVPPYSNSAQLFVDPDGNTLNVGEVIMVTDCTNASVGQLTNLQTTGFGTNFVHSADNSFTPGNSQPLFSNTFGADAEIARLVTNVYYIGIGANGNPALFRRSLFGLNMGPQELVDNVENLQVLYGEDLDGDGLANTYIPADEVAVTTNVASVRVSLLFRTEDNIASTRQTYVYDGETVEAEDLRIRRVFTTTVKLRNRGIL
jgi:type IV pilus assembly protein PilW